MKKAAYLAALALLFLHTSCTKQAGNTDSGIEWSKVFGGSGLDVAYGAVETTDGYMIIGYTNSNDGDLKGKNHCATVQDYTGKSHQICGRDDGWTLKLNRNGDTIWQSTYGGAERLSFVTRSSGGINYYVNVAENSDRFTSITPTPDGNYMIAGQTNQLLEGDFEHYFPVNPARIWLSKVGNNNTLYWTKILQSLGKRGDSVTCIAPSSNGFVIAGFGEYESPPFGPSSFQGFIVKVDIDGNNPVTEFWGGSGYDKLNAVVQVADGGVIAVGQTKSTNGNLAGNLNRGNNDAWILRSGAGSAWSKTIGGEGDDIINSVATVKGGGFIVAGQTNSNDGDVSENHSSNNDAWVIKCKDNGEIIWKRTYGGAAGDEIARSIIQTKDGAFVVAGQTSSNDGDVSGNHGYSDAWLFKIDQEGKLIWQQTLGGSSVDNATNVTETSDGGLLVTGYSFSNNGNVSRSLASGNYWVVKLKKQ